MSAQFTTIGHSNRSLGAFVAILREAQVKLLVDVRSFPRSRKNPVFNIECLPQELMQFQIGYRHCPALGGRRPKQLHVDENVNALWRVQSFHNYADYALGNEFAIAFAELLNLGRCRRLTLMCSEAVWWRCHRRIIADYLLANGHEVDHLMGSGQIEAAILTSGAQRTSLGKVT
ncbi:MAG: DNA repair protein [Mesorhizobium sp. 61-13]|nr:MAG: DNA repair protein [Mesorhizobium sp. 61-13]